MPTKRKGLSARDAQAPSKITLPGSDTSENSGSSRSEQQAPAHITRQRMTAIEIGIKTITAMGSGAGKKLSDAFDAWAQEFDYEVLSINPFMGLHANYDGESVPYYSIVIQYRVC